MPVENLIPLLYSSTPNTKPLVSTRLTGELWMNFADNQLGLIDAGQAAQPLLAVRFFSTLTAYSSGDCVVQGGKLYVAKAAVPAGPFVPAQWAAYQTAVDNAALYLALTGGTLTGPLLLAADPSAALGAATKQYVDTKAGAYLPLAGGTLTGALAGNGATFIAMTINGAAGTGRNLIGATAGVNRWLMQPGNSTAEGGSNTGSDFGLTAYADNGSTVIGTPLLITRSTMAATFGGSLACVSAKFNADPNFAIGGVGAENVFTLGSGYFLGYNRATGLLRWVTTGNTIQAMTIDAPGNLTISGTATKPGGGSWAAPSDARIKIVEGDYKGGLDEVLKLSPVLYRYKNNTADPNAGLTASEARADGPQLVGLVAQAVEAVMPEMVTSGSGFIDGVEVDDLRILDTTPLIFALVNAVKTLAARVAELEGAV